MAAAPPEGGGPPPPPPPAANAPPTAALALYQDGGHGPLTVSVDGGASEDPEGGALTYRWNFGDQHQAQGVAASHTYPEQGTYVLSLTVADLQGASNTINQNVSVKREELVCNAEN